MEDTQSEIEKGGNDMQTAIREAIGSKRLYDAFLECSFLELEELLYSAESQDEKNFYAGLCQFFIARNHKKVMEQHPF
jgi:hypothetical protein